jgi:hypothetical protein
LLISKYRELRAYVTENLTWLVASRRNRALTPPPGRCSYRIGPRAFIRAGSAGTEEPSDARSRGAVPQEGQRATAEMPHLLRQAHESRT